MKNLLLLLLLLLLGSCYSNKATDSYWVNKTVYNKVGFHYSEGVHHSLNILSGANVPLGSELTIIYVTEDTAKVLYGNYEVLIKNSYRVSRKEMDLYLSTLFSEKPVQYNFPEKFQRKVDHGLPVVGMTKNQVIRSCGYPPAIGTKGTGVDRWRYWVSRYKCIDLFFNKGKLKEIRDAEVSLDPMTLLTF